MLSLQRGFGNNFFQRQNLSQGWGGRAKKPKPSVYSAPNPLVGCGWVVDSSFIKHNDRYSSFAHQKTEVMEDFLGNE